MFKRILIALLIAIPVGTFSQSTTTGTAAGTTTAATTKKSTVETSIPVQAQYSNKFRIKDVTFSKKIDPTGRGEYLEVEFRLENMTDDPIDLYLFVIATYEKAQRKLTSFDRPIPQKDRIWTFEPSPDDKANFQYPEKDEEGKVKKDEDGKDKLMYIKFPRDPKKGEAYHLKGDEIIRTRHLSKYRKNYFFFNEVAILVFDKKGRPAYRQLYNLKGFRR
ncbi:MAG: hypothetical protein GY754_43720 [bacterium]|nr:hypothetical protein [bacterium]